MRSFILSIGLCMVIFTSYSQPKLKPISVAVSSSESTDLRGPYAADGKMTTRWASKFGDTAFIYQNLGDSMFVTSVRLYWETAKAVNFSIEVSMNGKNWKTVASVVDNKDLTNIIPVNQYAQYVRMKGTKRSTAYGFSLYEFEVYGVNIFPQEPSLVFNEPYVGNAKMPGDTNSVYKYIFGALPPPYGAEYIYRCIYKGYRITMYKNGAWIRELENPKGVFTIVNY